MRYSLKLSNNYTYYTVVGFIIILTIFVRINEASRGGLQFDELQSTTFSYPSIDKVWQDVVDIDPHPPLHYIQLSVWMDLFGTDDFWLRLNPVMWSVLGSIVLLFASAFSFNRRIALLTILLAALLPTSIFYAHQVRMYSQLMFFAVLSWYATALFLDKKHIYLSRLGIIVASIGALYTHGVGPFILFSMGVYAGLWLLADFKERWRWFRVWFIVQFIGGATYIPYLLAKSELPNLRHLAVPTLEDVPRMIHQIFLGDYLTNNAGLTLIFFSIITLFLIVRLSGHKIALAYVIIPIVLGYAASHLFRPVWILRTFSYIAPFMAVLIAVAFDELILFLNRPKWKYVIPVPVVVVLFILVLMVNGIQDVLEKREPSIKGIAKLIEETSSGAEIAVRGGATFWGVAWYTAGPGSVFVDTSSSDQDLAISDNKRIFAHRNIPNQVDTNKEYWLVDRTNTNGFETGASLLPQAERYRVNEGFYMQRLVAVDNESPSENQLTTTLINQLGAVSVNLIRNSDFSVWEADLPVNWNLHIGGSGNRIRMQDNGIRLVNANYAGHPERLGLTPGNEWGEMYLNSEQVYIVSVEIAEVREGGLEVTFWGSNSGHQVIDVITMPGTYVYSVYANVTRPTLRPLANSDLTLADFSLYWLTEIDELMIASVPTAENPVIEITNNDDDIDQHRDNQQMIMNPNMLEWDDDDPEGWLIFSDGDGNSADQVDNGIRLINDDYLLAPERLELIPEDPRSGGTNMLLQLTPGDTYYIDFDIFEIKRGGVELTLWSRATGHQVIDTIMEAGVYSYEVIAESTRPTIRPLPNSDVVVSYLSIFEEQNTNQSVIAEDQLGDELVIEVQLSDAEDNETWRISPGAEDNEIVFTNDGIQLSTGSYLNFPDRVEIIPELSDEIQSGDIYQFSVQLDDIVSGGIDISLWSEDTGHQLIARITEPGVYTYTAPAYGLRPTLRPLPETTLILSTFSIRPVELDEVSEAE